MSTATGIIIGLLIAIFCVLLRPMETIENLRTRIEKAWAKKGEVITFRNPLEEVLDDQP